jgi:hypothetical protein
MDRLWQTGRMRTDGPRLVLLSAVGIPTFIVGAIALLEARGYRQIAFAFAIAAGGSTLVWLAVSGRSVGRPAWLATGILGLIAFGASLPVWRAEALWPTAALHAIFWWMAAVLLVVPAGQAIRAVRRARQVANQVPGGRYGRGVESSR